MTPPIIFLDIDGVIVPDGDDPSNTVFHPRCVETFKTILVAVPGAKVVFSTTWRLPRHLNRLHAQWTEQGFPENLAIDGTPDLREDPSVSRLYRRGLEIRAWLDAHSEVSRWVVIDDERLAIESILDARRCVFTNPARGLTADEAERATGILST